MSFFDLISKKDAQKLLDDALDADVELDSATSHAYDYVARYVNSGQGSAKHDSSVHIDALAFAVVILRMFIAEHCEPITERKSMPSASLEPGELARRLSVVVAERRALKNER